jgi:hypothetical protein
MMKLKTVLFLTVLTMAYSAQAYPTHMFWCGVTSAEPKVQVYFEIEDSQLQEGIGTIKISRMSQNAPVNSGWQVIESATNARAKISWRPTKDGSVITAIDVDMGRSGHLSARAVGDKGFVVANLLSLNLPQGATFDYCNYFLATGARPAMTGSN